MGTFFDVFVIYHYLLAQLNQVKTPAAGTLLYAYTANGFCSVVSERKKKNVYLLAFNLLSMEIQVNVIHSWMNV